jgi:hypothetical protein
MRRNLLPFVSVFRVDKAIQRNRFIILIDLHQNTCKTFSRQNERNTRLNEKDLLTRNRKREKKKENTRYLLTREKEGLSQARVFPV